MKINEVLDFVRRHELAVIATVDKAGKPEAAVVEFGELDELTIIIDTLKTSRKYENLQTNAEVALVIGWDEDISVQINATARELSGTELETAKTAYFAKNNRAKKWQSRPDIAYFAFKANWVRYSDVSKNPWQIEEIEF